jgi:hypothetical protein
VKFILNQLNLIDIFTTYFFKIHFSSEHQAATLCTRQLKLFIEGPSEKPSRNLVALDKKKCRLVTGHCSLRQHVTTMDFSESTACRKGEQEKESSLPHTLSMPSFS